MENVRKEINKYKKKQFKKKDYKRRNDLCICFGYDDVFTDSEGNILGRDETDDRILQKFYKNKQLLKPGEYLCCNLFDDKTYAYRDPLDNEIHIKK